MSKKTYEQILEMAYKKPLTVKQFDDYFKPIELDNGDGYLYDYLDEAQIKANKFIEDNNLKTSTYQHIWTVVDGDSGKPCALNGYHMVNRLGYMALKLHGEMEQIQIKMSI